MSLSGHVHHFALVISIYDLVIFIDASVGIYLPSNSPALTRFSTYFTGQICSNRVEFNWES